MRYTLRTTALAAAFAIALAQPANANTLRFAFQGDAGSLDPYFLNETFTLGFLGNIYEGLTRRGPDLTIEPGLAERWEIIEPTRWRFYLRRGVKFHNGEDFTADDVVFSAARVAMDGSDLKTRLAGVIDVVKVDDYTVDFVTEAPNPILNAEWDTWFIMSKSWAETNNAVNPGNVRENEENYAAIHTNGTGPFMVEGREVDVRTTAVVNPNWWDTPEHNLERVVLTPIAQPATRVSALLTGEIDMIYPVPVQDIGRIDDHVGTRVLSGPELRTIFLGMDQLSETLGSTGAEDSNPFKDIRVRQAFYQAIDIDAIKRIVMRDLSNPTGEMIAPEINGADPARFRRLAHDPEAARSLLADAGYPNGFQVAMDCPNDRYVNDSQICQAITAMLARIGVDVALNVQPKAIYFPKVLSYDTRFYLLGWTPGSFDSWNPLFNLLGCRDGSGKGQFNLGGYCSPAVDRLAARIQSETDKAQRDSLISQAWQIIYDDLAHIPLHQQRLAWGVRDGVTVAQRPDNVFSWRHVRME